MKTIKYYAKNVYGNRTMYLIDEKMKLSLLLFNGHTTITGQDMKAFNQLGFLFEEVMEPKKGDWKSVLSENISKEIDTDHGVLRAYWETCKDLIKLGNKTECMKFLQETGRQWGQFKATEMKGDMIDAGIFTK